MIIILFLLNSGLIGGTEDLKNLLYLLVVFAIITVATGKNIQKFGKIIVEVDNIIDNKGIVLSQLFHNPDYFPTKSAKAFRKTSGKISNRTSQIIYDNVPFGEYAITVHHDEDKDGWMNKNFFGYPSEGYGLSNNPTIIFKLPNFDECKFKFKSKVKTIHIKMKN